MKNLRSQRTENLLLRALINLGSSSCSAFSLKLGSSPARQDRCYNLIYSRVLQVVDPVDLGFPQHVHIREWSSEVLNENANMVSVTLYSPLRESITANIPRNILLISRRYSRLKLISFVLKAHQPRPLWDCFRVLEAVSNTTGLRTGFTVRVCASDDMKSLPNADIRHVWASGVRRPASTPTSRMAPANLSIWREGKSNFLVSVSPRSRSFVS